MGAWIGTRVYTPALFAAFAFGVAMIEKGNLGWGAFWIDFAIAGWAVATVVGVGFVGPELGRIDEAAQEFGPESAGGRASREAAVRGVPLRHGAPDPHRHRHDREAVLLRWRATTFPS